MRSCALLLFVVFCVPVIAHAQKAKVHRYTAPLVGRAVLAEQEDKYNALVFSLEAPDPDANIEKKRLRQIKQESAKRFPRREMRQQYKSTSTTQAPIVTKLYVADSFAGTPPDNDMAISKDGISVSVINSLIAVHKADSGKMTYRRTLKVFANAAGLNNISFDYKYDPKIIYDPKADRFICVMLNSTNAFNWIVLAFSETNDPSKGWNFYKFYGDYSGDTTWFDYPTIAITDKEFFLTGNKIKFNASWQAGFTQSVIYQVNKESGYRGDSLISYQVWDSIAFNGKNIRNFYPVKGGDDLYGSEQYFLSNRNFDIQNDTIFLIKLADTIGSTGNSITIKPLKADLAYGVPPQGRQPDTAYELATNDGRILGAYRAGDEVQFVSTTVHPGTGNSAVYHGRISYFATTPVVKGSYVLVDSLDFGYPNISFAGIHYNKNHSIISFNYTGPKKFAGMGAVYYDGFGHSGMTDVKTGDSNIVVMFGKSQRWGDYMGSQPMWNDIGNVWVEGINGRKDRTYGNYIARLTSPYYGIPDTLALSPGVLYPNPAYEVVGYDFELQDASNISFVIYDIAGKLVDEILNQPCKKGVNRIQFHTGSLAKGVYILKAINPQGKTMMSHRFLKG